MLISYLQVCITKLLISTKPLDITTKQMYTSLVNERACLCVHATENQFG